MKILTIQDIQAQASGKTILIGEHSAVYGYKAVALALPDINLNIVLEGYQNDFAYENKNWINVWHTIIHKKLTHVEERINLLLLQAFEKSLNLVGFKGNLSEYFPQKIVVNSCIPLGGGMGGSAAMSTCLVRIAAQIVEKSLSFEQEIQYANEVDSLFHYGKASGLDVSAVASNGIIEFQKGFKTRKIENKCEFWLALIDSQERSETSLMIKKVKDAFDSSQNYIDSLFKELNSLASICIHALEKGDINNVVQSINYSHTILDKIGISTPKINTIVEELKKLGALGAKVTGAGGGGLVMGIFSKEPSFLFDHYEKGLVYVTKVF